MPRPLKIHFDGGCRPNPGTMEFAVVAGGIVHRVADAGHGTSTDAEWLALIAALRHGQALGTSFVLLGDAADVIRQATHRLRCRTPAAVAHLAAFDALAGGPVRIRQVARSRNLAGIALARHHPR